MEKSKIHWTDYAVNWYTWNCNKVSPGCKNCYAERRAMELGKMPFRGTPEWRENAFGDLKTIPPGSTIFVNTHSDTYHEGVPVEWIARLHDIVIQHPQYIFLFLTKRIERAYKLAPTLKWPSNLWLGTSVENQDYVGRISTLRKVPAQHRFISFEPLLGAISNVELEGIGWAIVGGESGPGYRIMDKGWAMGIRRACLSKNIPYFFKQGHGLQPGQDRLLGGELVEEFPPEFTDLKLRYTVELPTQMSLF